MNYPTVSKVQAKDGSLHDTVEKARKHDAERIEYERHLKRREEIQELTYANLYCAQGLPHEYNGTLPTLEDIAEFVIKHWAELKAIVEPKP